MNIRKRGIIFALVLIMSTMGIFLQGNQSMAKIKFKKGYYYNVKNKKLFLDIGSPWDKGNEISVSLPRPGDPHHVDTLDDTPVRKGNKIICKYFTIKIKGKKKVVFKAKKAFKATAAWYGKKKTWLDGTYKFDFSSF